MQTIINKSGPYLTVIILAVIMVAFFQPTSAEAYCCKRKANFGCCGKGPCNIFCCHCEPYSGPNASCNAQCENTNCNTGEWASCAGVLALCGFACTEPPPSCSLCMGALYAVCAKCYSGGVACDARSCPPTLQCISGKCVPISRSDESEFLSSIPDDLNQTEGGECQAVGVTERDNFFESIANRDGESTTISKRDLRRFLRQEEKRTGMVVNATFSEIFDAYDIDDDQLIDRYEFDLESDETVDFILVDPN
ncbi:MAG: EF-hand domain-containing protein [ANME-2 cluster archaeon]|nr:MAG: EF-hand domain-containing protein [ANME-2 cluster archaeon]